MSEAVERAHWCPWHDEDVRLQVLRRETHGEMGAILVCEPCPRCGGGEQFHDTDPDNFCWCEK